AGCPPTSCPPMAPSPRRRSRSRFPSPGAPRLGRFRRWEDVHRAVDAARQAQRSWAHVPFSERKAILLRFHDAVLKNRELLMDMVQLETGKNRASAFDEVMDVANNSRYYANNAEKILSPKRRRSAVPVLAKSRQHFQP